MHQCINAPHWNDDQSWLWGDFVTFSSPRELAGFAKKAKVTHRFRRLKTADTALQHSAVDCISSLPWPQEAEGVVSMDNLEGNVRRCRRDYFMQRKQDQNAKTN